MHESKKRFSFLKKLIFITVTPCFFIYSQYCFGESLEKNIIIEEDLMYDFLRITSDDTPGQLLLLRNSPSSVKYYLASENMKIEIPEIKSVSLIEEEKVKKKKWRLPGFLGKVQDWMQKFKENHGNATRKTQKTRTQIQKEEDQKLGFEKNKFDPESREVNLFKNARMSIPIYKIKNDTSKDFSKVSLTFGKDGDEKKPAQVEVLEEDKKPGVQLGLKYDFNF